MSNTEGVRDEYMLKRGFGANNRINLQHFIWKDGLGYLVHPCIPIDRENMRIADIGSGTCIWLIELSRQVHPSTRLDGLDVSHDQSPPETCLPPNVHLRIHDCLQEPPPDLIGEFDLVHLQNFNSIIKDNDPAAVIRKLLKMLKPGGYITWGEYDFQTWQTEVLPGTQDYDDELGKLFEYNATFGHTKEPNFHVHNWTAKLPETFAQCGMVEVVLDRKPFSRDMTTFLLDTFMVASEELSTKVLDPLGGGRGDTLRSYIDAVGRSRRNIEVRLDRLTVIGRKPLK